MELAHSMALWLCGLVLSRSAELSGRERCEAVSIVACMRGGVVVTSRTIADDVACDVVSGDRWSRIQAQGSA